VKPGRKGESGSLGEVEKREVFTPSGITIPRKKSLNFPVIFGYSLSSQGHPSDVNDFERFGQARESGGSSSQPVPESSPHVMPQAFYDLTRQDEIVIQFETLNRICLW
jgi:hypothetical protein